MKNNYFEGRIINNRYKILTTITSGSLGVVCKAFDTQYNRFVALIFIYPHLMTESKAGISFGERIARFMALDHESIASTFECIREKETILVEEWIEGPNLRDILFKCHKNKKTIPYKLASFIGMRVSAALDYAYNKKVSVDGIPLNIIHGNINPTAIMVSLEGEVKLTDFGVAQTIVQCDRKTSITTFLDNRAYLSPEVAHEEIPTNQSDIFSLGIVLWECITGKNPFAGRTYFETLKNIITGNCDKTLLINSDIPEKLKLILQKAVRVEKEERYQTAKDMYQDIKELLKEQKFSALREELKKWVCELFSEELKHTQDWAIISKEIQKQEALYKEQRKEKKEEKQIITISPKLIKEETKESWKKEKNINQIIKKIFDDKKIEILQKIWEDETHILYKAIDKRFNRPIGVRICYNPSVTPLEQQKTQYVIQRCGVGKELDHENILPLFDYIKDGPLSISFIPWIDGPTLRVVLQQMYNNNVKMPWNLVSFIGNRLCSALKYAYQKKKFDNCPVTHLGIEPNNILLSTKGEIKLASFGIPGIVVECLYQQRRDISDFEFVRKIPYLSPEVILGKVIGSSIHQHQADIFSLGVVLFELLTLKNPFEGSNFMETLSNIKTGKANIQPLENIEASERIKTVIKKSIVYDSTQRYQSAEEMEKDLQLCIKGEKTYLLYNMIGEWIKNLFDKELKNIGNWAIISENMYKEYYKTWRNETILEMQKTK